MPTTPPRTITYSPFAAAEAVLQLLQIHTLAMRCYAAPDDEDALIPTLAELLQEASHIGHRLLQQADDQPGDPCTAQALHVAIAVLRDLRGG